MSKISTIFGSLFILLSIININYYLYSATPQETENAEQATSTSVPTNSSTKTENPLVALFNKVLTYVQEFLAKIKKSITDLFSKSGSQSLRLVAAMLLGILLSLTPCIYPMIPITVGILQLNQSSSLLRSFTLAGAYTFGISTVFAILGFIAAIGGATFGKIQGSPLSVIPLAALLIYLGLSMLGLYELYIPRFLQPKVKDFKGGSIIPTFIFGMASGLIASPCLSPGLLLILDYVSSISVGGSIKNYIEGFMLLFAFGIGSSLPLLIIGTFTSSMKVLPRAGAWMVEIKKLVGLMLIAMAFYHLSNLTAYIPYGILLILLALTLVGIGLYYLMSMAPYDSKRLKIYKTIMGGLLLGLSVGSAKLAFNEIYTSHTNDTQTIWLDNYKTALAQAIKESKPLFIDIESSVCPACKSLDKKVFKQPEIMKLLETNFVPLKINNDINEQDFNEVNSKYGPIRGFPTYLIVSKDKELVKRMGSELGESTIAQIIELFKENSK